MAKKETSISTTILIGIGLILTSIFAVVNTFITEHGETMLKKVTGIEVTTNEILVETKKVNNKIQDVEIIREDVIVEPIIQPIIIQEVKHNPDTFIDRTNINKCMDDFKRACILDGNEKPEDCIIDSQVECEEDPTTRF